MPWEGPNTVVYPEAWAKTLQAELDEPTKYEDICEVIYTRDRVVNNPFGTDPTVQSLTRNCAYSNVAIVATNEAVTVNGVGILAELIDRADLAQSTYLSLMYRAKRQAVLLKEHLESNVYGDHAARADIGAEDLTTLGSNGATTITVSASNIDDIIRTVYATILLRNGASKLEQNGAFFVWRPQDFVHLLGFMQANGFNVSDSALRSPGNPSTKGVDFMGFTHFTSNLLTANHVMAGVKKLYKLYVLPDTFGQIMVNDKDPGNVSGVSVVSRVDFIEFLWNNFDDIVFDVNVS